MIKIRLGDSLQVKHGFAFSGSGFGADLTLPQLLTPGNFARGERFKENVKSFCGEVPPGYRLKAGDVVVTMTDLSKTVGTLGLSAIVPAGREYLHNQRIGLVQFRPQGHIVPKFFHYLTRTDSYRRYIVGTATGTTVRHTSPGRIEALELEVPEVNTQEAIARVLSVLDDKISANRNVCDTGFRLLQARYESVQRSVGRAQLSNVAQTVLGGTPSRRMSDYWGGSIPWINSGACNDDIITSEAEFITQLGLERSAAKLLPAETTCVAITGATLGQMGFLAESMAANQSVVGIVANSEDRLWLHFAVRAEREQLLGWATGGAQQHVNKHSIDSLIIAYEDVCAARFGKENKTLMWRVVQSRRENEILAATRDELLPLLMSGKITVKDAEKTVEEVI